MMGGHAPGIPPDTVPPGEMSPVPLPYGGARDDGLSSQDYDIPGMPGRRRRGSKLPLILGGSFVFLVLLGAIAWWATHRTPAAVVLPAQVRNAPTGDGLLVSLTIPGAQPGTKLRYNGQEFTPDAQGAVEFPANLPATQVGTIDLPVELVTSDGPQPRTVRFTIAWRVEPDLQRLGDDPPAIHLVFHVPPGASLAVANQPIRVSGDTGIAALPAPAPVRVGDGDTARRDRFPIRVTLADGTVASGEYELRIPRTALRVEAPSSVSAINAESVIVQGTVAASARVMVGREAPGAHGPTCENKQPATVTGAAFTATVPLQEGANNLCVVAYSRGGAPALAPLAVYRNVTPEAYLAAGGGNRGVAALRASPLVNGARVRVNARAIGELNPAGPEGPTFQVVVEDRSCPNGRCPAWVNVGPAVTVTNNAVFDVVGEIRGARSYVTSSGERRSDPVIQALFVNRR